MKRKIVVLKYGETVLRESYIFKGGQREKHLPISFAIYLIQDGERNLLVDAGCNDGAGFHMSLFSRPVLLLEQYGLSADHITDIIVTHHHHDHVEAIKDYPNAVIHIQKEEYELTKDYIPKESRVELFDEGKEILEDLEVRKIGGHSVGSCVVFCRCNGTEYLFCGDECYVEECLKSQIPTGTSERPDVSEDFVKRYGNSSCHCLLFHDKQILEGRLGTKVIDA